MACGVCRRKMTRGGLGIARDHSSVGEWEGVMEPLEGLLSSDASGLTRGSVSIGSCLTNACGSVSIRSTSTRGDLSRSTGLSTPTCCLTSPSRSGTNPARLNGCRCHKNVWPTGSVLYDPISRRVGGKAKTQLTARGSTRRAVSRARATGPGRRDGHRARSCSLRGTPSARAPRDADGTLDV